MVKKITHIGKIWHLMIYVISGILNLVELAFKRSFCKTAKISRIFRYPTFQEEILKNHLNNRCQVIFTPVLPSSLKINNFICMDRNVNFPVSDIERSTFQIIRFCKLYTLYRIHAFSYMNVDFYIFLHIVVY